MATLALTTVGTALGGSVGGAVGALIGQSIDQGMFGHGPRKGPRLGDLAVQTSSYGSPIPQIYGTMRVAGTVVWATDLIEHEVVQGGGKGSPERTAFSYSANLAVALSSRPIKDVGRIWADGKLIRGAQGDFKIRTHFRLALGGQDQQPDQLIASIEGVANAPAYRGLALAIFEELELAEFGNRIPSLTFEVIADAEPVLLAALMTEASNGLIDIADSQPIVGFAAHGTSVRDSLTPLVEITGMQLLDDCGRLRSPDAGLPFPIKEEELGCVAVGPCSPKLEVRRDPEADLPSTLTLSFYDRDRDYQMGHARASSGELGRREARLELPAVLTAADARRLAEQALARRWLAGEKLTLQLPPSRMTLKPGDSFQLPGRPQLWIARSVSIEAMAVVVDAEPSSSIIAALPADPGRSASEPDLLIGRTNLALFEMPSFEGEAGQTPLVYLAASNEGCWKALPVSLTIGDQPLPGMALGRRSRLGYACNALDPGCSHLVDERSEAVVQLFDFDQLLLNVNRDALAAGANLALVGEELIQFGRAEIVGEGRYRLTKLLRGRRGTEWAAAGHSVGESFCLIDPVTIGSLPLDVGHAGATLAAVAHGVGDVAPLPLANRLVSGEGMRPPSPCHLHVTSVTGGILAQWVRRSYRRFSWADEIGDGGDSFPERYRVTVVGPAGIIELEPTSAAVLIESDQIPAQPGQSVELAVATIGSSALSHPARLTCIV